MPISEFELTKTENKTLRLVSILHFRSLIFVPCILDVAEMTTIWTGCTTPLFYKLAATCFGSSLSLSGSFFDPSELLEIQTEWVGALGSTTDGTTILRPRNHTLYDTPPIRFVFQVTQKVLRNSLMMAGYCRNMKEPFYRIKKWYNLCISLVISTA
jgi:hypothetical protein